MAEIKVYEFFILAETVISYHPYEMITTIYNDQFSKTRLRRTYDGTETLLTET